MKTKTWSISSLLGAFSLALMLSLGACNSPAENSGEESQEQSAEESQQQEADALKEEPSNEHPSSNEHPN